MTILSKIKKWWLNRNSIIEARYSVVEIAPGLLTDYHDSLGWFLEKLGEEKKLPNGVIHLSTIGTTEREIIVVYDVKEVSKQAIESFLKTLGLVIKV